MFVILLCVVKLDFGKITENLNPTPEKLLILFISESCRLVRSYKIGWNTLKMTNPGEKQLISRS